MRYEYEDLESKTKNGTLIIVVLLLRSKRKIYCRHWIDHINETMVLTDIKKNAFDVHLGYVRGGVLNGLTRDKILSLIIHLFSESQISL